MQTLTGNSNQAAGDLFPNLWGAVAVNAAAGLVVAAYVNRKSFFCQHNKAGVGIVYIGYDNTVAANLHVIALAPGEWFSIDDYRGEIWAIRSGAATNLMISEV